MDVGVGVGGCYGTALRPVSNTYRLLLTAVSCTVVVWVYVEADTLMGGKVMKRRIDGDVLGVDSRGTGCVGWGILCHKRVQGQGVEVLRSVSTAAGRTVRDELA